MAPPDNVIRFPFVAHVFMLRDLWANLDDDVVDPSANQDVVPAEGVADENHPAPVAVAPPANAIAPNAPAIRGRFGTRENTPAARLAISAGMQRAAKKRAIENLTGLSRAVCSTFANLVSNDVFGLHCNTKPIRSSFARTSLASDGDGSGFQYPLEIKRTTGRLLNCGVAAYMKSQATELERFCTGCRSEVITVALDDANIWVRAPASQHKKCRVMCKDGKERVVTRGRNKHCPY